MNLRDEPEGIRQDSATFLLFDPSGANARPLVTVPDTEKWLRNRDGTWGRVELVFGEDLFGFVSGSRLWVGRSGDLRWQRIDLRTGRSEALELPVPSREASAEDIEAERQRRLAAIDPRPPMSSVVADGVDMAARFAAAESAGIREVPARDRIPVYDRVVSGSDGAVWLREYPEPRATRVRWALMSAEGDLVGQLSLPRTTTVLDASFDWMVTTFEDDLGAPVIRVARRVRVSRRGAPVSPRTTQPKLQ